MKRTAFDNSMCIVITDHSGNLVMAENNLGSFSFLFHDVYSDYGKFIYKLRDPERGEVLIFRYPRDPSRDFIKRVIAIGGDTIEIKDGRVYLNGQMQTEDYILERTRTEYPKVTVPEGTVFVMGDNRNASTDSRRKEIGMVDTRMILGRAYYVVFPIAEMGKIQ